MREVNCYGHAGHAPRSVANAEKSLSKASNTADSWAVTVVNPHGNTIDVFRLFL